MEIIIGIVILVFFLIATVISFKIGDIRYRAKQQILKNTGISSSNINAGMMNNLEKKQMERFLAEHSEFTEESIKDLLKNYTVHIFNRETINEFSQSVYEKMQSDSKLDKMRAMEFRRANITHYKDGKLCGLVVYTDNRDEYEITLYCSTLGSRIQLDKYEIRKGTAVGF